MKLTPPPSSELDNRRRWDGRSPGHYEVWYLTFNHRASRTGGWIRYTLEAPTAGRGEPRAELWFAHFDADDPGRTFAFHRAYPIGELVCQDHPFALALGGALLGPDRAHGELAGAGHRASWSLHWAPSPRTFHLLPPAFYLGGGVGDTTVLSPSADVALTGTIEVDGRRLDLRGEPGGQTHLWGRKHAHAWAWGRATWFADGRAAHVETLTARLRRAGRLLPPLTVVRLAVDGEELRFNRIAQLPFGRGWSGTGFYRFAAAGPLARVEGEFTCRPEDMVMAEYEDPDGEPAFCANTEVADLRLTLFRRTRPLGRWREAIRLDAPGTGHFEVASRERDPAIGKPHHRL